MKAYGAYVLCSANGCRVCTTVYWGPHAAVLSPSHISHLSVTGFLSPHSLFIVLSEERQTKYRQKYMFQYISDCWQLYYSALCRTWALTLLKEKKKKKNFSLILYSWLHCSWSAGAQFFFNKHFKAFNTVWREFLDLFFIPVPLYCSF